LTLTNDGTITTTGAVNRNGGTVTNNGTPTIGGALIGGGHQHGRDDRGRPDHGQRPGRDRQLVPADQRRADRRGCTDVRGRPHPPPDRGETRAVDAAAFVALVRSRHPALAGEIDDPAPNPTLAAGALARLTQRAIDGGDRPAVRACLATALTAWDEGDDRVQNAVGLSYVRRLDLTDGRHARAWAWSEVPSRLRAVAASVGLTPPGGRT
jgi:hypothetical protein